MASDNETTIHLYENLNSRFDDVIKTMNRLELSISTANSNTMTGCVFTPISNFDKDICTDVQIYNFNTKSFTVDIPLLKKKKTEKMFQAFNDDFENIAGDFGKVPSYETSSYWLQIQEAEIVVSGGQNPTPFLSTLLTARGVEGETLSTLAALILSKADAYKTTFGAMLGKYQNRIKAIAKATTVEEIKAVSW